MVFRSFLLIALVTPSFLVSGFRRNTFIPGIVDVVNINQAFDAFIDFLRPVAIANGDFTVDFDDWDGSFTIDPSEVSAPLPKTLAALKDSSSVKVDFHCTNGRLGNLTTLVRNGDVDLLIPAVEYDDLGILAQTGLDDLYIKYGRCDVRFDGKSKVTVHVNLKASDNTFEHIIVLEGEGIDGCTVRVPDGIFTELGNVKVESDNPFVQELLKVFIKKNTKTFTDEMGCKVLDSVRALLSTNDFCDFLRRKYKNKVARKIVRKLAHHR